MKQLFKHINLFSLPETEKQAFEGFGNDNKAILLILRVKEWDQELKTFLGKILKAVDLDIEEDIYCINITNHSSISFSRLPGKNNYQNIICFGLAPTEIGLTVDCKMYQPFVLSNKNWLFAHNLQDIFEERQQGKKQMAGALWNAMKQLFLK